MFNMTSDNIIYPKYLDYLIQTCPKMQTLVDETNTDGSVLSSVDSDQMLHSNLGIHCLFRAVCPNI